MKQRILQVITSLLLIITLTMANFLLLCVDVVSYAAEEINADKSTNHKNVEFMTYFKDEKGNKVTEINAYTNSNDLKLYFQISVKQEGYFNGNIVLNSANFKLKTDTLSDGISKIENNVIYLNQISAGESKEIELGIELLKDEQFDLNLISMESKISIEGVYRDSTQKDISIKAEKNITLNFVSPYTVAEESIVLSQEVITNKILKFNGEDKRVIQIQVKSGLKNNLFPISKSIINMQAPKISDIYPEDVIVNSNDILATNGKELSQDSWNYNKETGLISINVENKEENNKVSWIKTGEDKFVVTYIFDKDIEINNEKLDTNSKIELYDTNNTSIEAFSEITLTKDEKDTIVTTNINQYETSIYKGKLYAGISRDITYINNIDINLNNVASEIDVKEEKQIINEQTINSVYKTSKMSKANIENILGEGGSLDIINAETGNIITTINKDSQADENGNIVISYPENVTTITIKLVEPEKIGKLEIETTKTINAINKNIVRNASSIEQKASISYVSDNKENTLTGAESNIILNETETSASLEINRTELSTMTTNNNVEFRITLNSKGENNELFKNPVLRLELPEKIQDIQVNSIKLLYEDEMKIKTADLNNKTIEIVLDGEQTKYKEEAIDGAIIIIDANLTTSTKIPSSTEQVKLTYTNEKAVNYKDGDNIGTVQKDINIVSYAGVVTTNQISEYGIDVVNNEGTKAARLAVSSDTKNVTIEKKIINNKENNISNVKILGVFPTEKAVDSNNIDIEVGNLSVSGVDAGRIKVYYSNNSNATEDLEDTNNAWTEQMENPQIVKKYLVVIDKLEVLEEVDISYQITIPANLEYNESAEEGYNVYYEDAVTAVAESVKLSKLRLSTGSGPVVETTLQAYVGGEESSEVKQGEIIRYAITVSNTGTEDIDNVKTVGSVPEGTIYISKVNKVPDDEADLDNYDPYEEDKNTKTLEFNFQNLKQGEQRTQYYEVKVDENTSVNVITNKIETTYGEVEKESNEVKNVVKEADLRISLCSVDDDGIVESGYGYRYTINVKNLSDKDLNNVRIDILNEDLFEINLIMYMKDNEYVTERNNNYVTIEKIPAGGYVDLSIDATIKGFFDNEQKEFKLMATATYNNEKYHSNQLDRIVKSANLSLNITSENKGEYVKAGDNIEYKINVKNNGTTTAKNIVIKDTLSNDVTLKAVLKNGEELTVDNYTVNGKTLEIKDDLGGGVSNEYIIRVVVNSIPGNTEAIEISNLTIITVNSSKAIEETIKHILEPEEKTTDKDNDDNSGDGSDNEGNNGNAGNSDNNQNNGNEGSNSSTKVISGVAWLDENNNGQKDSNEKLLSDISVKLFNTENNKIATDSDGKEITSVTNSEGFYSLNSIPNGEYLVIFKYDTSKYILTSYQKDGVDSSNSSKVITRDMDIDGERQTVGSTEIIKIQDSNIGNINIGLQEAKVFDLKLDKFVSKVVVQNSKGTQEYNYNDATLAKAEIHAKLVNSTTVVVEYTITVTNEGEVDGYAKKIADYLSTDYKFSSDLNKDWYQLGNTVYNTSLANEKIKPGESKEVKLIVTRQVNENNIGLINNTAEIIESYNEFGLSDTDSTVANRVNGEDDMGVADLILSIKTGEVVTTVILIITTILILGAGTFILARLVLRRRML